MTDIKSKSIELTSPRFIGKRFQKQIPIEILTEVLGYVNSIRDLAVEILATELPASKSQIAGRIHISLDSIKRGSSIPVFTAELDDDVVVIERALETAQNTILRLVSNSSASQVAKIQSLPERQKEIVLSVYQNFGKKLHPNDAVEFDYNGHKVQYNKDVRLRIVKDLKLAPVGDLDTRLVGHVETLNAKGNFGFRLNGLSLKGQANQYNFSAIKQALDLEHDSTCIIIGRVSRNPKGALDKIKCISHVTVNKNGSIMRFPEVSKAFDAIRALEDGWFDGLGVRYDATKVELVEQFVEELLANSLLPAPYIYPTEAGGIQLEWSVGLQEVSLTFDESLDSFNFSSINVRDGETIDLDGRRKVADVKKVKELISKIVSQVNEAKSDG